MAAIDPKGRSYFTKLLNRTGDVTPRRKNVINPVLELEAAEPFSRTEVPETVKDDHVTGPSKKSKKRGRSSKKSHSSSRRHRHCEDVSTEPLPESIFGASMKYAKFVQTSFTESSYNLLKAEDSAYLADSIIELSSRTLLIGKMLKAKNGNCVTLADFEKLKNDLAESNEKNAALSLQLKEMSLESKQQGIEKENLEKKVSDLEAASSKIGEEINDLRNNNQLLEKKVSELSSVKDCDTNTIKGMEDEIEQLKVDVFEAQNFILAQHKLGFAKALAQAKYFYKIPIDEGNFDVMKDFYNGNLVPVNEIPEDEADDIDAKS